MTLPQGWEKTTLGELGDLYCGQSVSAPEVNTDARGVVYVTGPEQWDGHTIHQNKWTESPKRIVPDGCIFVTVKGAGVGKTFPGIACAIGRDVYAFKPAAEVDAAFVHRAIRNRIRSIVSEARGDIPGLSKEHLSDHALGIPPLAEQRRIVAKLDALTARLARARAELDRVPVLAEQLKRAGLKAAFCGELTADTRDDDAQEPHFPPELDDQERGIWQSGQLPSSWEWVEFRAFFDDQTDSKRKLPEKEYEIEGAFPVVDQGKQQIGGYTSRSDLVHPASTPVIIFGDHTRCVKLVEPPFVQGADGVKVLAPSEDVDVRFARYALLAVEIPAKGYSRHMKFVRKTVWPLPPIGEQSAIVARLDAAFARADRLEAEATRARALLDRLESALLAKAFRGELVPQDPNDEPAQTLLDRIRTQRAAAPKAKRGRKAGAKA